MATLHVYLVTFREHAAVNLHAWDMAGDIRDVRGTLVSPGSYEFTLDMSAPDLTNVSFKFWYPKESPVWEREDFVRRVPSSAPTAVWTAEFSARCMTSDPRTVPPLPVGTDVTLGALTAQRFAGGRLFAWDPGSGRTASFPETRRDDANKISYFRVPLDSWMTPGFHFKLVSAEGSLYEPDQANRFWRPVDGQTVFIKSGQVEVRAAPPALVSVPISVIVPSALAANAALGISDVVDDFRGDAGRSGSVPVDEEFVAVNFAASVFPDALYRVTPRIDGSGGIAAYQPRWSLPLRVASGAPPAARHTLLGVSEWYDAQPTRDAIVDLHVHANPTSAFGSTVEVPWRLGFARRTSNETLAPVAATALAQASGPGQWTTRLELFNGVPQWIDTLRSDSAVETRADGPSLSQREIRPTHGAPAAFHTIDGQSGISQEAPSPSLFAEVSSLERARVMKSAFNGQIVDAGIFASHEMPHGATWHDDTLWFVLLAPHALQASVLLLDRAASMPSGRVLRTLAMNLTPDLRYFWCKAPRSALPDASRVEYRFLVNGTTEVLDPASRQVSPAEYVWAEATEGPEGAWSVVVDRPALVATATVNGWQTPFWNEFMIYELHAQRFTNRNNGATALPPLAQVQKELGRYLATLPVTALEFLPLSEFPTYISWGYNSSLHFAIESIYGGPAALASLVGSAHRAGKAVVLDVVYNHLTDSPMQAIARDVFADGETQWGDMVNYDHPACAEFFRQALVYLFDTFQVDGFRFDATQAIVNGHLQNGYIIRDGQVGSGGGPQFLQTLHAALDKAAGACGRRFAYAVAEHNPNEFALIGPVTDAEWNFDFLGKIGRAAAGTDDVASDLADVLIAWHNAPETVMCDETHDSCSTQDPNAKRIAARGPWGTGMRMAKACGALTLLAKGVPLFFMGTEAAETKPFFFDVPDSGDFLPLNTYDQPGTQNQKVLAWNRALLGLRKNWSNGFASNDTPYIGKGNRTLAFTRDGGRFFVIVTFGTPDTRQNLGWLGLPREGTYKEIFNSTWPDYNVNFDNWSDNGGYGAHLTAEAIANLPDIGAVVLERT